MLGPLSTKRLLERFRDFSNPGRARIPNGMRDGKNAMRVKNVSGKNYTSKIIVRASRFLYVPLPALEPAGRVLVPQLVANCRTVSLSGSRPIQKPYSAAFSRNLPQIAAEFPISTINLSPSVPAPA